MARTGRIVGLSTRLHRETLRGNWSALARIDADIAQLLLTAQEWNAEERAAVAKLRSAHSHALRHCSEELCRVEARLKDMQSWREGWLAYLHHAEPMQERT